MDPSCANESPFYGSNKNFRPRPKRPADHEGPSYARSARNHDCSNCIPHREHLNAIENRFYSRQNLWIRRAQTKVRSMGPTRISGRGQKSRPTTYARAAPNHDCSNYVPHREHLNAIENRFYSRRTI